MSLDGIFAAQLSDKEKPWLKCILCHDEVYEVQMKTHAQICLLSGPYECSTCNLRITWKRRLLEHLRSEGHTFNSQLHTPEGIYLDELADFVSAMSFASLRESPARIAKRFEDPSFLLKNNSITLSPDFARCVLCAASVNLNDLYTHICDTHCDHYRPFRCSRQFKCGYKGMSRADVEAHINMSHGGHRVTVVDVSKEDPFWNSLSLLLLSHTIAVSTENSWRSVHTHLKTCMDLFAGPPSLQYLASKSVRTAITISAHRYGKSRLCSDLADSLPVPKRLKEELKSPGDLSFVDIFRYARSHRIPSDPLI